MDSMKKQKDRILKEELPRSVGTQYATGDQWRNNSRKNEGMESKQKQHPVVNGTGDKSKGRCCKEQYCIGTVGLVCIFPCNNIISYIYLVELQYVTGEEWRNSSKKNEETEPKQNQHPVVDVT